MSTRSSGRDDFDIVADFAALFPVEIISSMLGVPPGERQQIRLWTDGFLHREENNPFATESGVADSFAMNDYFLDLSKEKRRQPDDLIISRLVTATYEDEAGVTHRLSDEDIATFAVLMAAAGSETVTKLVGNGVMAFHHNPEQWELVLADPGTDPRRDRGDAAAQPAFAVSGPVRHPRRHAARRAPFPAGSPTLLVTGAATRDPRAYDRPDAFDIDEAGLPPWLSDTARTAAWAPGWRDSRHESPCTRSASTGRDSTVDTDGLRRVTMSNVAGYSHIPVHVG